MHSKTAIHCLAACATTAALAAPLAARAEDAAACSVVVQFLVNGNLSEQYLKDFVVQEGVAFVDDFSTPTRFKQFRASVAKAGGDLVVSIDYASDVSALNSTDFSARLAVHGGGVESTADSHTFSTSTPSGFFRYATNHTLSCRKV